MGWRDQAELYRADDRQVIESGCPKLLIEEPQTTPEGNTITLLSSKIPLRGSDGKISGVLGMYMDITERKRAEEKIQQLSRAVEQNPASIVITDPAGNIEYVNPKFVELTGYTLAEVLGKNPRVLKSGDKSPEAYRELWQTITAGKEWRGEFHNKKKNGELYWESASISPIRDPAGRITHYVAVKEDITERKQAEEALRRSETKFRTLYDSTSDAVMLLDEKGFFDCNQAALAMFGCATREEFCSKHPADVSPPMQPDGTDSLTLANQQIATAMEKGSHHFEWMHKRADTGETFPAEVLLSAMELDGKPVLQAVVRDITERKRTEKRLEQSESRLRVITDTAQEAILMMDPEGRVSYWNPAAERILGYTSTEALGQNLHGLIAPARFHPAHHNAFPLFQQTGQGAAIGKILELEARRKDGREISVDLSLSAIRISDGWHVVGLIRDITERKQAEAALEKAHQALVDVRARPAWPRWPPASCTTSATCSTASTSPPRLIVDSTRRNPRLVVPGQGRRAAQRARGRPGRIPDQGSQGQAVARAIWPGWPSISKERAGGPVARTRVPCGENVEHIKEIVAMQQNYATVCGVTETINVADLVEDALRINAGAFARHEVEVVRDYRARAGHQPSKNTRSCRSWSTCVRNAKYACDESGRTDKQITRARWPTATTADQNRRH